jgi:hypothetical protein
LIGEKQFKNTFEIIFPPKKPCFAFATALSRALNSGVSLLIITGIILNDCSALVSKTCEKKKFFNSLAENNLKRQTNFFSAIEQRSNFLTCSQHLFLRITSANKIQRCEITHFSENKTRIQKSNVRFFSAKEYRKNKP